MFSGLTAQGVPAATATPISHLPPIGVLFASFLGYNPMQQLLGPQLAHLSAAHAAYMAGREFFPHLITAPFHDGLSVAFGFAIAANVIAAIASALTGAATATATAEPESPGLRAGRRIRRGRLRAQRARCPRRHRRTGESPDKPRELLGEARIRSGKSKSLSRTDPGFTPQLDVFASRVAALRPATPASTVASR